ncbi:KIR protein [Plasmodium coatneyi]|uniref:KIR protein n=1 Tax=Plasmodium coatneyi TaxID=208452 RepID=A0A1B1DSR3_9APIC|nr:KIR protein [Plasmodium coatneyi]ANQ05836.1 KIR protein [Plasmodium coatneyi]
MAPPGQKVDLTNLPSYTDFYGKFVDSYETVCTPTSGTTDQLKSTLDSALGGYSGLTSLAGNFMGAYCYACKKKKEYMADSGKSHLKEAPCQALYHWLGKYILIIDGGHKISEVLDEIYGTLDNATHKDYKCSVEYNDVENGENHLDRSEGIFTHRKRVFEHYYDCDYVKQYLQQVNDLTRDADWATYKAELTNACDALGEYCKVGGKGQPKEGEGKADPYCSWFNKIKEYYCETDLSKLTQPSQLTCTKVKDTDPESEPEVERELTSEDVPQRTEDGHQHRQEVAESEKLPEEQTTVLKVPGSHAVPLLAQAGLQSSDETVSLQTLERQHGDTDLKATQQLLVPSTDTTGNTTLPATAISSVLGIAGVGLPTFAYFLYKVSIHNYEYIITIIRGGCKET